LCGELKEVCITPFMIVSSSRFDLCDHLSKESVERDPALFELLNEDVGFFVNPNLEIKSLTSCALVFTLSTIDLFTFLLSLVYSRSSLLS
jgi:hypothetical protein